MNFLVKEQGEDFHINLYDHVAGLAVSYFDNDGREDIYFLNQHGPNALYRNKGNGTFEDVTVKAGVALDGRVSVAATFADYDNDGKQDLFVTTTRGGNTLFHNRGNGTFEDVTAKAGVAHVATRRPPCSSTTTTTATSSCSSPTPHTGPLTSTTPSARPSWASPISRS
jgi:hypothetical protein